MKLAAKIRHFFNPGSPRLFVVECPPTWGFHIVGDEIPPDIKGACLTASPDMILDIIRYSRRHQLPLTPIIIHDATSAVRGVRGLGRWLFQLSREVPEHSAVVVLASQTAPSSLRDAIEFARRRGCAVETRWGTDSGT